MAAGTLHEPGTAFGPCTEACQHTDCAATRDMAASVCRFCGTAIGYGRRFYDDQGELSHASCLEDSVVAPPPAPEVAAVELHARQLADALKVQQRSTLRLAAGGTRVGAGAQASLCELGLLRRVGGSRWLGPLCTITPLGRRVAELLGDDARCPECSSAELHNDPTDASVSCVSRGATLEGLGGG
jgi:hypothetical protein